MTAPRTYRANLLCQSVNKAFRFKVTCQGDTAECATLDALDRAFKLFPSLVDVKVGKVTWLKDCKT